MNHKPTRRNLLVGAVCATLLIGGAAGVSSAADYPTGTVTIVVGAAPGGGMDTTSRILAQALQGILGGAFVVENMPGSEHIVADEHVANAKPDGYTLVMETPTFAITAAQEENLPYDPLKDFKPVSLVSENPNLVLTHPGLGVKTMAEFIAWAKANPGSINLGHSVGALQKALGAGFLKAAGLDATFISYSGTNEVATALMSQEINLSLNSTSTAGELVKEGKLIALAIATDERWSGLPDVPTTKELGLNFRATTWYGLLAPAGTPDDVVQKIHNGVLEALKLPEVKAAMDKSGLTPVGSGPGEFATFLHSEIEALKVK